MKVTANNKKLLIIGGGAVALYAGYKLVAPKTDKSFNPNDPTGNSQTVRPNFNAQKVADDLYQAMKDFLHDRPKVKSILSGVNEPEFALVIQKFGSKPYNTSLGNEVALPWVPLPKHDLKSWLKNEMGPEYEVLRLKYPNIL